MTSWTFWDWLWFTRDAAIICFCLVWAIDKLSNHIYFSGSSGNLPGSIDCHQVYDMNNDSPE